jgi:hypothetical protein
VSCCQPPLVSIALLRHMPPVPAKLNNQPAAWRTRFSTTWWPSSISDAIRRVNETIVFNRQRRDDGSFEDSKPGRCALVASTAAACVVGSGADWP